MLKPSSGYLYRQENNLFIATNDLGSKQLLDITMTGSISCSKNYMTIILGKNGISHDFFIRDSAESIKQHREAIITPDELVTVIFQQI